MEPTKQSDVDPISGAIVSSSETLQLAEENKKLQVQLEEFKKKLEEKVKPDPKVPSLILESSTAKAETEKAKKENELLKATLAQQVEDMKVLQEGLKRQQQLHHQAQIAGPSGLAVAQPTPEPGTEVIFTNHAGKFEHGVIVSSSEYDGAVINVTGAHPGDKQQYEFVKVGRKGTRGTYHIPAEGELASTLGPMHTQRAKLIKRMEDSAEFSKVVRQKGSSGDLDKQAPAPEFAPVVNAGGR